MTENKIIKWENIFREMVLNKFWGDVMVRGWSYAPSVRSRIPSDEEALDTILACDDRTVGKIFKEEIRRCLMMVKGK